MLLNKNIKGHGLETVDFAAVNPWKTRKREIGLRLLP